MSFWDILYLIVFSILVVPTVLLFLAVIGSVLIFFLEFGFPFTHKNVIIKTLINIVEITLQVILGTVIVAILSYVVDILFSLFGFDAPIKFNSEFTLIVSTVTLISSIQAKIQQHLNDSDK